MTVSVDPLEAIWVLVIVLGVFLTLLAFVDARRDLTVAVDVENGMEGPRILVARGNVRHELQRLVVLFLLLGVAVPGLFVDRSIPLSFPIVSLIFVPVVLFTGTLFDARDRAKLTALLMAAVGMERAALALEASVQQNIVLTREAGSKADAAYREANTVNEKIATLTGIVGGKEPRHSADETPLDGAGEAVAEGHAEAATEVPDPSVDEGTPVDHGGDDGLPTPSKLD